MLMSDQIDVFEHDENVAKSTFRNLGLNPKLIKRIYILAEGKYYFFSAQRYSRKHYKAITTSIRHTKSQRRI